MATDTQASLKVVIVLAALFILTVNLDAAGQNRKLHPIDESSKDLSFLAFRTTLLEAIGKRDREYLLSVLHPKLQYSFGDKPGREGFALYWRLDQRDSEVWSILLEILKMGGSFMSMAGENEFCAPYVFSKFPEDLDPLEYGVLLGERVEVRSDHNPAASLVGTLGWDIVKVSEWPAMAPGKSYKDAWVQILVPDGMIGYVKKEDIRSPLDYRACFRQVRDEWLMMTLVTGD